MKKKLFYSNSNLRSILKPYRSRIVCLCLLTVLQAVLQVAMALLIRYVIDVAILGGSNLHIWIIAFLGDIVLQLVVSAVLNWLSGSTADRFASELRMSLLKSAMHSTDARLEGYHSGQLLSRGMEDVRAVCDGVIHALPSLVGQVTRLITAFAAVLWLYPAIAGIMALVAVVVIVGVACLRPVLKAQHREVRKADEQVIAAMQEDLQQLELIQSLGVRDHILKRFQKRLTASLKAKFKRRIWTVSTNTVLGVVFLLGSGVVLLWGVLQVADHRLSYGVLTSIWQLISQFRSPVLGLSGLWTRYTAVEVAAERLAVLLEIPKKPEIKQTADPKAIVFENVTFRYAGEETPVLENFSMRLSLDGWTCLTGVSGKGKTTLFKLILGLYTPESGCVYMETDQGNVICSEATRHLFAYVPQDYALFSGTVLENLLLVAPDADADQRKTALELAKAEFVFDTAAGENTQLRENNAGLSKGQLQRLAIARAILMDRPVLLLDECTSALDAETEAGVLHNLQTLEKHVILVTHRLEALAELNNINPVSMEA